MRTANPVVSVVAEVSGAVAAPAAASQDHAHAWIASARFVVAWLFPSALGLGLKWYLLADQGGFVRVSRSMGVANLSIFDRLGFFRTDLIIGAVAIPLALLLVNRYLPSRWAGMLTGTLGVAFVALIAVQILALKEVGRFSSLKMAVAALEWGWHEPGSNLQYLVSRETLISLVSLLATIAATIWAVKNADRVTSKRVQGRWRTAGELCLFAAVGLVLLSFKSGTLNGPYHQSSFVRSVASLWRESAVETGEFGGFDLRTEDGPRGPDFGSLSAQDLIGRYHQLTHAPSPLPSSQFFGKEKGANVLFFILETTPAKYLPVDGDMSQFPNMAGLRARSFVGTRHYSVFPITRAAVFSMFSSWYPIDDSQHVFDSPNSDRAGEFLPRLDLEGYKTAAFSPLHTASIPDAALFTDVGFGQQFYPAAAINTYDQRPDWKEARIAADVETLHLLESHIDQWTEHGDRFAAAFLPQMAHLPYPDAATGTGAEDMQRRGRAILAKEDGWLGEIIALLQRRGQLNNTIIVVVGDHGPRSITENPSLRRGTIDEIAFHVPLLIYAPRALDHSERINWLTSHIDIVPTLLDLLGEKGSRDSEQGSAIWNPGLADRATYFFARPMFGADGYATGGQFFMWHYFSDSIYEKSEAQFDATDIIPRASPVARDVASNLLTMRSLEKAWHARFALSGSSAPPDFSRSHQALPTNK